MALEYEHLSQVRRPENQGGYFVFAFRYTDASHTSILLLPPSPGTHCLGRATRWSQKESHPHAQDTFNQFPLLHTLSQILYSRHRARESTISCSGQPPDSSIPPPFPFLFFFFSPPLRDPFKDRNPHKTLSQNRHLSGSSVPAEIYGGDMCCRGVCLSLWHKPLVLVE